MATGFSIHLGLNNIDHNRYKGEYSPLRNAENDAIYYYDLAIQNNFRAEKLIGEDATSDKLLDHLKKYSDLLVSGDLCFITYSGHGTRVKDLNEDEDDGYDEALVLYDRLFIDDEFKFCWAKFKSGVKVFFINDSCYNGTMSRFINLHKETADLIYPDHILRGIDSDQSAIDFENNISYFKSIKLGIPTEKALCSIINIGACQDNQLADDGLRTDINSKFTLAVKDVLNINNSIYSYRSFFDAVKLRMPPWQTPNWDTEAGYLDESFEKSQFLALSL